ncbi:MAG: hypothetical protein ABIC40_07665, partial [bacterium]
MNRCVIFYAALLMALIVAVGCSSGGGNPVTPTTDLTNSVRNVETLSQTHLWGYYDVYIDIPTQTATAVL